MAAAAAAAGRCVLEGPFGDSAVCYHGACAADGACECLDGFIDDNWWFDNARCFLDSRWLYPLVGLSLVVHVVVLVLLFRLGFKREQRDTVKQRGPGRKPRGPGGKTPVQRLLRLGIVTTAATGTSLVVSVAFGGQTFAVLALSVVAITSAIHAMIENLSMLLITVSAFTAPGSNASGLGSKRGNRRFLIGLYGLAALTEAGLLVVGLQMDDAELIRVASPAWWVYNLFALSTIGVLALMVASIAKAKASVVDMIQRSIHMSNTGSKEGIPSMEALKVKLTTAFWALRTNVVGYAITNIFFIVVGLLLGAIPFGTVQLILGDMCGPLSTIPYIIQARKATTSVQATPLPPPSSSEPHTTRRTSQATSSAPGAGVKAIAG
jgi:hypothetical protein